MSPACRPLALAVAVSLLAGRVSAHEKWFFDAEAHPTQWASAWTWPNVAFVLGPVALTALAWIAWRARDRRHVVPGARALGATTWRRSAFYGVLPVIVAVHLAVPLLVSGVQGTLFAPHLSPPGAWVPILGVVQVGIALALFYGGLTRVAALALAGVWLLGVVVTGPEGMLENAHVLGFAAFFWWAGRGPLSVDRMLFPRLEPTAREMQRAMPALRIGLGVGLVVLAFTEKLANVPLATAFLGEYPLNVPAALGLPLPDRTFVLSAGAVELTIGLFLLFGLFAREVILVAWLPFNLTLGVFDWVELIGHLPVYGVMAALLVWEDGREERRTWVRGLRSGPLAVEAPEPAQRGW